MASLLESVNGLMMRIKADATSLDWSNLKFGRIDEAILFSLILVAGFVLAIVIRYSKQSKYGQKQIVIPAIIRSFSKSPWRFVRHIPLALFITGLPFFILAFADPYISFTKEDVTYSGRRIAILVDASGSMNTPYLARELKPKRDQSFFTAIAAAEHFMKLRMNGKYRDLMALIEFGNESYIITPFTVDYQNILTSIKLISEPEEWARFSDKGTIIIKAIDQSVELFRTFNFLKAAGNIIVLISDGEDRQVILGERTLESILAEARQNNILIYFLRVNYGRFMGSLDGDAIWKNAVEKTGGKFYPAFWEPALLSAINDIDQAATGKITVSRYSTRKPFFGVFLTAATLFWATGTISVMSLKFFRKFP